MRSRPSSRGLERTVWCRHGRHGAARQRGLTAILDVQDLLRDAGGDLRIATTNATQPQKSSKSPGSMQHLEIFDSVIDAVKSLHTS